MYRSFTLLNIQQQLINPLSYPRSPTIKYAEVSLFKFCLFSSEDFEFFRSPEFLGSSYLLMVASPYEAALENGTPLTFYLAPHEFTATEKNQNPTPELITELANELKKQLPLEAQCKAIFDLRKNKSSWNYQRMQPLHASTEKLPLEIQKAQKYAENYLLLKLQERKLLAPTIPWKSSQVSDHVEALSRKSFRTFYNLEDPEIKKIIFEHDRKKKLLLHVCCGPDAAGVVEQLQDEFDLTCFWYDPNIQPKAEYDLRLEAFLKVTRILNVPTIVGEYDVANFLGKIKGLEASPEQGAKCTLCYDMRLERSAIEAKKINCDLYSTTLAISPHKVQEKLKLLGSKLGQKIGVPYLARNFMKEDGFKDSVIFTEEHNIYRQDYCGCWFSLHEGGPKARELANNIGLTKDNLQKGTYSIPRDE